MLGAQPYLLNRTKLVVLMYILPALICSSLWMVMWLFVCCCLYQLFCKVVLNKKQLPFWVSQFAIVCLTLCELVPIGKLFPPWIICTYICLLLFIIVPIRKLFPNRDNFQYSGSLSTLSVPILFLPSDVDINLGLLLLRLCSFDEAVLLFPY